MHKYFIILFLLIIPITAEASVFGVSPSLIAEDIVVNEANTYTVYVSRQNSDQAVSFIIQGVEDNDAIQFKADSVIELKAGENSKAFNIEISSTKTGKQDAMFTVMESKSDETIANLSTISAVAVVLNFNVYDNEQQIDRPVDMMQVSTANDYYKISKVNTIQNFELDDSLTVEFTIKNTSDNVIYNIPYIVKIYNKDELITSKKSSYNKEITRHANVIENTSFQDIGDNWDRIEISSNDQIITNNSFSSIGLIVVISVLVLGSVGLLTLIPKFKSLVKR